MPPRLRLALPVCLAVGLLVPSTSASAVEIWSGLTYSFTKPDFADFTLPQYQDQLTPNVTLTRGDSQGLFNIAQEMNWDDDDDLLKILSPLGTLWATELNNPGETVAAANWASLDFDPWIEAYGGQSTHELPDRLTNNDAVVFLSAANIYLDLRFTSWSIGAGGFAYLRAEPPAAEPSGDYNGDGTVNAADYTLWRDTLGQSVANPGDGADGDLSSLIDAPDYDHWKARFGNLVPGAGGASVVPEPWSLWLCGWSLSLLVNVRRFATPRSLCRR
jgi:hypothetical protein